MSVINKMLQDLERRVARSDLEAMQAMPSYGADHGSVKMRRRLVLAAGVVLIVVVAGGAALWFHLHSDEPTFSKPAALVRDAIHLWRKEPKVTAPASAEIIRPSISTATSEQAAQLAHAKNNALLPQSSAIDDVSHQVVMAVPAQESKTLPLAVQTDSSVPVVKPVIDAPLIAASAPGTGSRPTPAARRQRDVIPEAVAKRQASMMATSELGPKVSAESSYRVAAQLIQADRMDDAILKLEEAIRLDPRHAAARQTLIGLLLQKKDSTQTQKADQIARAGLALDPSQTGMTMILARLQLDGEGGKDGSGLQSAIATLTQGLAYATGRADYQAFLAALLQRDHQDKAAIAHYMTAVLLAPTNGLWWMGLGISYENDHQPAQARAAYSRALDCDTLNPALRSFVNDKLARLG